MHASAPSKKKQNINHSQNRRYIIHQFLNFTCDTCSLCNIIYISIVHVHEHQQNSPHVYTSSTEPVGHVLCTVLLTGRSFPLSCTLVTSEVLVSFTVIVTLPVFALFIAALALMDRIRTWYRRHALDLRQLLDGVRDSVIASRSCPVALFLPSPRHSASALASSPKPPISALKSANSSHASDKSSKRVSERLASSTAVYWNKKNI